MKAENTIHNSQPRIKMNFLYYRDVNAKLRQIADSGWGRTMSAWHIPYTKDTFQQLKEIFFWIELPETTTNKNPVNVDSHTDETGLKLNKQVHIQSTKNEQPFPVSEVEAKQNLYKRTASFELEYTKSTIYLKIPKNDTDIQSIRTFQNKKIQNKKYISFVYSQYPYFNQIFYLNDLQQHIFLSIEDKFDI